MAKPSTANVNIATDTFNGWVTLTNVLLHALANEIVTANTEANGSITTGNSFVNGIFSANVLTTPSVLRGGNVQTSNTLSITSNVVVGNTFTVNSQATFVYFNTNTSIQASNVYVNSTATTLIGNTVTSSANLTTIGGNTFTVSSPTINLNSNVNINTDLGVFVASNTNLGADTTSALSVLSFAKADYAAGKVTSRTKNGTNTQIDEILVAHDTTSNAAQLTVYGSVRAPSTANVGVYSVSTNATHVVLGFRQTQTSSSIKLAANLIK